MENTAGKLIGALGPPAVLNNLKCHRALLLQFRCGFVRLAVRARVLDTLMMRPYYRILFLLNEQSC